MSASIGTLRYSPASDAFLFKTPAFKGRVVLMLEEPDLRGLWARYSNNVQPTGNESFLKQLRASVPMDVVSEGHMRFISYAQKKYPLPMSLAFLFNTTLEDWVALNESCCEIDCSAGLIHVSTPDNILTWDSWGSGLTFPLLTRGTLCDRPFVLSAEFDE